MNGIAFVTTRIQLERVTFLVPTRSSLSVVLHYAYLLMSNTEKSVLLYAYG